MLNPKIKISLRAFALIMKANKPVIIKPNIRLISKINIAFKRNGLLDGSKILANIEVPEEIKMINV